MMCDMWNLVLVFLETVLVSVQDTSTICTKYTIGSEIILDAPDGIPRLCGHVECHFGAFGNSLSVSAR
jgi:hypothetical protein